MSPAHNRALRCRRAQGPRHSLTRRGPGEAHSRCRVRPRRPATACDHLSNWWCASSVSSRGRKASFSSISHVALAVPSESAAMMPVTRHMEGDMRQLLAIIFGMALAAVSLGAVLAADTVELVSLWNPTGALPDGCSPALTGRGGPVKWVIVDTELDGPRGVAEVSADPTDYRFPLCIADGVAFSALGNVDASVRFRPVAGKVDQA